VHHGKGIGGAPLSLLFLIRELDRTQFQPTVLCIHESEAADLFRNAGIETLIDTKIKDFSHTNVLWYPWWQLPKIFIRLLQIPFSIQSASAFLQKRHFDIVHLNTSTLLAFGIAVKRAGVKVVWHIREPLQHGYIGLRRWFVRRIVDRNADLIIPICHNDAEQLLPSANIHVVYNFVDFNQFDTHIDGNTLRRKLGIHESAKMILHLGGINREKGTHIFIEAAKRILQQRDDVFFVVAGEIPKRKLRNILNGRFIYSQSIRHAISEKENKRILFLGVRSDIPELLAASTLLVFPSTVPHFARPLIEASAMSRPVIASDLGGPRELVLDGKTGFLIPPHDPEKLAEKILEIIDDQEKLRQMGKEGNMFAHEQFDAKANAKQIIDLYTILMHLKN